MWVWEMKNPIPNTCDYDTICNTWTHKRWGTKRKEKRRPTGKMNFYTSLCFVPLLLLNYAKYLFLTDITFNKNHSPVAVCHQLMIWTAHFERSALQPLIHTHTQIHSCTHTPRAGRDMKDRCRYFVRIWHSIFLYMRLYLCKLICFI